MVACNSWFYFKALPTRTAVSEQSILDSCEAEWTDVVTAVEQHVG